MTPEEAQKDPRFQSLSPEAQKIVLAKLSGLNVPDPRTDRGTASLSEGAAGIPLGQSEGLAPLFGKQGLPPKVNTTPNLPPGLQGGPFTGGSLSPQVSDIIKSYTPPVEDTLPQAAAMGASMLVPGAGIGRFALRSLLAGAGGGVGKVGSNILKNKSVLEGVPETAATQGAIQGIGEGVGKAVGSLVPRAQTFMEKALRQGGGPIEQLPTLAGRAMEQGHVVSDKPVGPIASVLGGKTSNPGNFGESLDLLNIVDTTIANLKALGKKANPNIQAKALDELEKFVGDNPHSTQAEAAIKKIQKARQDFLRFHSGPYSIERAQTEKIRGNQMNAGQFDVDLAQSPLDTEIRKALTRGGKEEIERAAQSMGIDLKSVNERLGALKSVRDQSEAALLNYRSGGQGAPIGGTAGGSGVRLYGRLAHPFQNPTLQSRIALLLDSWRNRGLPSSLLNLPNLMRVGSAALDSSE